MKPKPILASCDQSNRVFVIVLIFTFGTPSFSWVTDGLCVESLGNAVNSFIDRCFKDHHFFNVMRQGQLRNLYKVSCCPGYRQVSRLGEELKCQPICRRPCSGGTCIKPDTCLCRRGYFQKSQYECLPICHPSCKNGDCVGVDQCKCLSGYKLIPSKKNECEPVCQHGCINGICISPETCQCNTGYRLKKGSTNNCEPSCHPPCINGTCTSVGKCQCLIHYELTDSRTCKPVCPKGCGSGECLSPDLCSCPAGYSASRGEPCQPMCSAGCGNGTCVAPEICHCSSGYTFDKTKNRCEPVCQGCFNGLCIGPDKCQCKAGFTTLAHDKYIQCVQLCDSDCINGVCVDGICKCHIGYAFREGSTNECEPTCKKRCINGICIAPEICKCNKGYEQFLNNSCKPTCLYGCGAGICVSPNICNCPEGYDSNNACEPKCSTCQNGYCVAPEVCLCNIGHFLDSEGLCTPKCDKTCVNGECISVNECQCLPGFRNISDSECVPECSEECINGYCSSPETCRCSPGYNVHPEETSFCLPELGLSISEATPFLNTYKFASILSSVDNETFYFSTNLRISVNKPCASIFPNNQPLLDSIQIFCQQIDQREELQMILYCEWPSLDEDLSTSNHNTSYLNATHVVSEQENLYWNLTIYIEFPENFLGGSPGVCFLIIHPSTLRKNFIISDSIHLNVTAEDFLQLSEEIKLSNAGVSYPWIIFLTSIIIILTSIIVGIIVKMTKNSKPWNQSQVEVQMSTLSDGTMPEEIDTTQGKGLEEHIITAEDTINNFP